MLIAADSDIIRNFNIADFKQDGVRLAAMAFENLVTHLFATGARRILHDQVRARRLAVPTAVNIGAGHDADPLPSSSNGVPMPHAYDAQRVGKDGPLLLQGKFAIRA